MKTKFGFQQTIWACYLAQISHACINNLVPLLLLTFQSRYNIPIGQLTVLVSINFFVQLILDLVVAKFADKIGYRILIVTAHILAGLGLISLAILPEILPSPFVGLLISVIVYGTGGGILEVLISPITEACPGDKKSAQMSLLHSFYCWGHVIVVVLSTIFFVTAGIENWKILVCVWAALPLANSLLFSRVPIAKLVENEEDGMKMRDLFSMKIFWIFLIIMICAGASEQAMSQWSSAFAELGLGISKTLGDLMGPCLFAILMGLSRILYAKFSEKINLIAFMFGSTVLCVLSYLLAVFSPIPILGLVGCGLCGFSVGIMWPGTFSLASAKCPKGGTVLFALLALGGDIGCSGGPATVGFVSGLFGGEMKSGLLAAVIFPAVLIIFLLMMKKDKSAGKA